MSNGNYGGLYSDIVGIAVLASSGRVRDHEAEITSRLYKILDFLKHTNAKDSDGNIILDKARTDYLAGIKSRAIHLFTQTTELKQYIETAKNAPIVDEKLPEKARDFYNRAYYCVFFCARYLLVANTRLDTNVHEKISDHLNKLASHDGGLQETVDHINSALPRLRQYREKADYHMAPTVINELLDKNAINETLRIVSQLFAECRVA